MVTEKRLIDANAFIADIEKQYCKPCKEHGQDYNEIRCRSCWVDDGIGFLEDTPTVDAVEVVRCKDCEHSEPCICVVCEEGNTMVCRRFLSHVQKDHFCSCGERRTDNGC